MMETNSPSLTAKLTRRKTKVLVGPASKYFSTFTSRIMGKWSGVSDQEPGVRGQGEKGDSPPRTSIARQSKTVGSRRLTPARAKWQKRYAPRSHLRASMVIRVG